MFTEVYNSRLKNRKETLFCFLLQMIYKPLNKAEEMHIQFYFIPLFKGDCRFPAAATLAFCRHMYRLELFLKSFFLSAD